MAAFVVAARPDRAQNRRLALMLVFEGTTLFLLAGGLWFLDAPDILLGLYWLGTALVAAKLFVYLNFLATLPTRLARPLRSRMARIVMLECAIVGFAVAWVVRREWFTGLVPGGSIATWMAVPGPWFIPVVAQGVGVMFLMGLVFSLSAWRESTQPQARRQARMFAVAFGTRDVLFAIWAFTITQVPVTASWWVQYFTAVNYIWLVYIPLVAYGILKAQLFDIDLKVKFAVEKGTVVSIFAGAVFVLSEIVEQILGVDQLVPAVLAAGGIALAVRPLARVGQRVADRVMPGVRDTAEYRLVRKREVYRAAVGSALQDGTMTPRERGMLATLEQQLGLTHTEARAIEREAAGAAGV